jgi:hypothetical protein
MTTAIGVCASCGAEHRISLGSPNGWQRDMAQQMLVQRQDVSAAAPFHTMLRPRGTGF